MLSTPHSSTSFSQRSHHGGDDFTAAIKANAMVGGDNASRAVAIGMVLGAYHGVETIPTELRDGLNAWDKAEKLMDKVRCL